MIAILISIALILGILTWCSIWWVCQRRAADSARVRGVHQTGPAPAGATEYLEALCSVMGWAGVEVEWFEGRIPAGYGGEVERLRAHRQGEPGAERVAEIGRAVSAEIARRG